jgi:hypothetical protein
MSRDWDQFLTINGDPLNQHGKQRVVLFGAGMPNTQIFWDKPRDRLVCVTKFGHGSLRPINSFLTLQLADGGNDLLGFELGYFTAAAARIWEMQKLALDERISLKTVLLYYEGMVIVAAAKESEDSRRLQTDQLSALRQRFGSISFLQPVHAVTLPL